jgi:hypothetical protein
MTTLALLLLVLTALWLTGLVRVLRSDSAGHAPDRTDTWSAGRLPDHPYVGV